jgi:hypothetical protein
MQQVINDNHTIFEETANQLSLSSALLCETSLAGIDALRTEIYDLSRLSVSIQNGTQVASDLKVLQKTVNDLIVSFNQTIDGFATKLQQSGGLTALKFC